MRSALSVGSAAWRWSGSPGGRRRPRSPLYGERCERSSLAQAHGRSSPPHGCAVEEQVHDLRADRGSAVIIGWVSDSVRARRRAAASTGSIRSRPGSSANRSQPARRCRATVCDRQVGVAGPARRRASRCRRSGAAEFGVAGTRRRSNGADRLISPTARSNGARSITTSSAAASSSSLSAKHVEDRALGDTRRIGDLADRDTCAVLDQQRRPTSMMSPTLDGRHRPARRQHGQGQQSDRRPTLLDRVSAHSFSREDPVPIVLRRPTYSSPCSIASLPPRGTLQQAR